MTLNVEN